jgi:hypothetical protein
VEIYHATTGAKLDDDLGNEVYGRITHAAGVYTLAYFSRINGVETAYTMPATQIDFEFTYVYTFASFPTQGVTGVRSRRVTDDIGSAGLMFAEALTVTGLNTIAALTKTPVAAGDLKVIVNGKVHRSFGGDFTLASKTITWVPVAAGYNLETTDEVSAEYRTFE